MTYWGVSGMPLDGAFLVVAAMTAAAALACAAGLLRGRSRRSPRRETAAVLLIVLSGACCALSASGLRYHDLGQPVRAPDRLATDLVTMTAMFTVLGLLILSGRAWHQAWPRIGHRLTALIACVTGMALCSGIGAGTPESLAYFTLYVAFLGTALAETLAHSWQQAQLAWHRPLRHGGLLLTCGGAAAGIAALIGQTVWAVAKAPHLLPPALPAARSCAGLVNPVQCAFTVTLPGASVLLAATGVALPVVMASAAGVWQYWRQLRMLHLLSPLWERMRNTFPEIQLPEHGPRARMDPAFRLYRRVIEIGAGRRMLRPYLRPEVSSSAAEAAFQFGLRGEELRATVEAAEIVAALRARRTAGSCDPQAWEPPPDHSDADVPDLPVETAWLVKVARAYATSPIVYQLMTPRRR